jgi:hypothetical protein
MQQAKRPTGQPLLTDEETDRMMELVSARLESVGHPRDSEGKPVLTQEIISDAMLEVVRERYEKKFQQLERQFVKPLAAATERFEQRQPDRVRRRLRK